MNRLGINLAILVLACITTTSEVGAFSYVTKSQGNNFCPALKVARSGSVAADVQMIRPSEDETITAMPATDQVVSNLQVSQSISI